MIGKISAAVFARIAYVRLASLLETAGAPLPVKIVIYVLCFASVVLFCMWKWQESLLYMPAVPNPQAPMGAKLHKLAQNPPGLRSPAEQDLRYEDVTLTASDGVKLSAWFIPAGNPAAPTIIFAHENAGNMGLRLQEFKVLHDHVGCHVLCYDYRGYGDSDEAPINEEGLMADALAAWRWLAEKDEPRVDRSRIFLYGRSLGGAVTIQLARLLCEEAAASAGGASSALLPAGVLVGNTFTSISEMLGSVYPFLNFGLIRRHLLRLQWRSIEHIRHVRVPISFMVGTDDELVPPAHTEALHAAATAAPSVKILRVPGGKHNDTWLKAGPRYTAWLCGALYGTDSSGHLHLRSDQSASGSNGSGLSGSAGGASPTAAAHGQPTRRAVEGVSGDSCSQRKPAGGSSP